MSPPTEFRGLYDSPTTTLNAFSLEKVIFENRAFVLERQTQPEAIPHQTRSLPRCTCVTLTKPTYEDYLAPFVPPICTWAQKPMRHSPLMTSLDSLPIESLDELEESTTSETDASLNDGLNHEHLLYKVQAPTLLKLTFILFCMWLLRSIHTWWTAKQSQLRFERLLASASFGDLVDQAKSKSSSRVRTKAPRKDAQEKSFAQHHHPPTQGPSATIKYLQGIMICWQGYSARLKQRYHTSSHALWLWLQRRWQSQLILLNEVRHKSTALLEQFAINYCSPLDLSMRLFVAESRPSVSLTPTQSQNLQDAATFTTDRDQTSSTTKMIISDLLHAPASRDVKAPQRRENSKSPIITSTSSGSSRKTSATSPQLKASRCLTSSPPKESMAARRGSKEVRQQGSFSINLTDPNIPLEASTAYTSGNQDGKAQVAKTVAAAPVQSRLCRLQATVLCIESKEPVSCGTQTAGSASGSVSVGVETTHIESRDSSVQTTPPRRPAWIIQRNETIVAEAEKPTWTRMKMKHLRSRPMRRHRRLLRGEILRRSRDPQPKYDQFLQQGTWVVGRSSGTEAAGRLFGENQTTSPPAGFNLVATATSEGLVQGYPPPSTPETLTTCTTTPTLSLQWVKPKEGDDMDTAKNSLEPPPGFERFSLATAVTSQQQSNSYIQQQRYAANADSEGFRSAPPLIQGAQGFIPRSLPAHDMFPGGVLFPSNRPYVPPVTGGPLPMNVEASCGAAHIADLPAGVDLLHVGKTKR